MNLKIIEYIYIYIVIEYEIARWRHCMCLVEFFVTMKIVTENVADACECGNEPSGSIKCGELLY